MDEQYENLRIRTLSQALDAANDKVSQLEQALIAARREHGD